jgi:predicted DNA-binding transcriptional regulator YafY
MSTPATRLITLIMLLQRQPSQKAAALAEKLGVSVRTLHRYLGMLEEMGIPIYTERGPNGGLSLVRGYKLPPLVLTPEEAVAIYLGASLVGQMWGQLYREPAQGALAKLENVLPDEQREEIAWARRSLITTGLQRADPRILSPLLEKIRRAARLQQQVKIGYLGSSGALSERLVDPYAMAFRSGWCYLVGHCHLRRALRTFRVDRIRSLELLSQDFEMPEDFDAQAYLEATLQNQPGVSARLRFTPEGAHIDFHNLPGWESSQPNPDGSVDVSLTAPDLQWMASIVMSFSTLVVVLEPPELRDLVREWARGLATIYEE